MTIEFICTDCENRPVLTTSPEIGDARGVLSMPYVVLNQHLIETGHENFTSRNPRTKVHTRVGDHIDPDTGKLLGRSVTLRGTTIPSGE